MFLGDADRNGQLMKMTKAEQGLKSAYLAEKRKRQDLEVEVESLRSENEGFKTRDRQDRLFWERLIGVDIRDLAAWSCTGKPLRLLLAASACPEELQATAYKMALALREAYEWGGRRVSREWADHSPWGDLALEPEEWIAPPAVAVKKFLREEAELAPKVAVTKADPHEMSDEEFEALTAKDLGFDFD